MYILYMYRRICIYIYILFVLIFIKTRMKLYIYIGRLYWNMYPKKLQFAAHGQLVLVFIKTQMKFTERREEKE